MDRIGLVLRAIVFYLFPIPFLLSFAVEQDQNWTAYAAYLIIVALLAAAAAAAWSVLRRREEP